MKAMHDKARVRVRIPGHWNPRTWLTLALCWVVAVNPRTVILGVSHVLPTGRFAALTPQ